MGSSRKKLWSQRAAFVVLAAFIGFLFFPSLAAAARTGAGLAFALLYLLAFLLIVMVIPAVTIWLMSFVYSVLLRPYVRAWHINRIRNARYLRDAVERGEEPSK
jgi:hypothetical protein